MFQSRKFDSWLRLANNSTCWFRRSNTSSSFSCRNSFSQSVFQAFMLKWMLSAQVRLVLVLGFSLCLTSVGCSGPERYVEEHEIKHLKIVFLDEESLHDEWKETTGQHAVRFLPTMKGGLPSIKTVKGFYDFSSRTLYCPKWNFKVCGHELHHAALGQFHSYD